LRFFFDRYLNRQNISNAHNSLLEDLDLSEQEFTGAAAIFFVGYSLTAVPLTLAMTRLSGALFLTALMALRCGLSIGTVAP
jgi:hypothetical protein